MLAIIFKKYSYKSIINDGSKKSLRKLTIDDGSKKYFYKPIIDNNSLVKEEIYTYIKFTYITKLNNI